MKKQRYLFTPVLAVLLWLLWLGLLQSALVSVLLLNIPLAISLAAVLFGATIAGIWSVDAAVEWSTGQTPWGGPQALAIRFAIAAIATALFAFVYARAIASVGGFEFTFLDGLRSQGFIVLGSVWIATQIVDLLIRNYGR